MPPISKTATGIRAIAKRAGVSTSAVSKVLNHYPGFSIGEDARARILKAVKETGYQADAAAQTLRRGHSDAVGLILHSFEGLGLEILRELERALRPAGKSIEVAVSGMDPIRELSLLARFARRRLSGVLVVTSYEPKNIDEGVYQKGLPPALPVVYLDSHGPWPRVPAYVGAPLEDIPRLLGNLKLSPGTRVLYLASGRGLPILKERRGAFDKAAAAAGLLVTGHVLVEKGETPVGANERLGRALRQAGPGAVSFWESLSLLEGFVPALTQSGFVHGKDHLICGYDAPVLEDPQWLLGPGREVLSRPIAYIQQDAKAMVARALAALGEPGDKPQVVRLPGRVVYGG